MRDIIDGEFIGKEEASKILNRAISVYKVLSIRIIFFFSFSSHYYFSLLLDHW